ncbi:hypothetical protein MXB_4373 [Myxobolus squamalis]|nr:hypothetical protein MXB_4373 [Myxobolus squamalis]
MVGLQKNKNCLKDDNHCKLCTILTPPSQDEKLAVILNEDLYKTASGNLFILLINLVEHNEIISADMDFMNRISLKKILYNMGNTF